MSQEVLKILKPCFLKYKVRKFFTKTLKFRNLKIRNLHEKY